MLGGNSVVPLESWNFKICGFISGVNLKQNIILTKIMYIYTHTQRHI